MNHFAGSPAVERVACPDGSSGMAISAIAGFRLAHVWHMGRPMLKLVEAAGGERHQCRSHTDNTGER